LESPNNDSKVISEILYLAHSDPKFRKELFKKPEKVLEQFNVSDNTKKLILKFFDEIKN